MLCNTSNQVFNFNLLYYHKSLFHDRTPEMDFLIDEDSIAKYGGVID